MIKSIIAYTHVLVCVVLLYLFPVEAATLGNVKAGQVYAKAQCAQCHSIVPDGNTSPNASAPPFQAIADTKGMTRTALFVFFRSPHATMPNLIVRGDDLDNIIDYMLSLKSSTAR